jgi:anaerobic magnesium-protoporphyrin IX monomethyl ester cyclase
MTDCLVIGFNDSNFEEYEDMVRSMGTESGAYRDLGLAFINYEGKPQRSMDILNHFYFQSKGEAVVKPLHNADFLWPVVTYLGTYLARRGYSFDYVNLFHLEKEKLREKLEQEDILTIAITTTLYVSPYPILEIISFIRQYNKTARILVGGPFMSGQIKGHDELSLQHLLKLIAADIYVISQEGETALVNIISTLKSGGSLDKVENIAYRKGEKYILTSTSIESNPLEENMVNYSLFPQQEMGEFVTLRTAKSCPFSCAFCGFPQRAGKYKYQSVELVEQELDEIRKIGSVTTLTFLDDTFNVPKERFKEILRMMIKNEYGYKWNSFYRCDHGDEEAIELMGKAGCEGVFLGVESGSDEMLLKMNKTARQKDYMKSIPLLRAAGISTHANLIIGFPGETYETVRETVNFVEESKPDFFRAQLWYADPVTPIWEKREQYGVKGTAFNWSHNTMNFETACDLIDKLFVSVENSIWLPQNGFEQWSTFYLQRKGMTVDQIKTFLKCFNAAIKEKLTYPGKKDMDPLLLESLKTSCQFDGSEQPDMTPVEVFSGYEAAQQYWVNEFIGGVPASNIEMLRDKEGADVEERVTTPFAVSSDVTSALSVGPDEDWSTFILAAYGALLLRINGQEDLTIVSSVNETGPQSPLPLRFFPSWNLTFAEFLQTVRQKSVEATRHRVYGLHILTNPLRLSEYGCAPPVFDVGYNYNGESRGPETSGLGLYPQVDKGLRLLLNVTRNKDRLNFDFSYMRSWFRAETIEKLGSYLDSILKEVSVNPTVVIGEIALGSEIRESDFAVEIDAHEVFNF